MEQPVANTNVTSQLINGMSRDEMAVIYCSAILADDDVTITADKLTTLLRAANLSSVEPIWPTLYARALGSGCDVKKLLTSVGALGASASASAPGPHVAVAVNQSETTEVAASKNNEQPPVDDDDDDDDLNLDLFG